MTRIPLGLGAGFILLRRGNLSPSSDTRVAVVYLVSSNGNIQYLGVHCQYEESAESTIRPAHLLRAFYCLIAQDGRLNLIEGIRMHACGFTDKELAHASLCQPHQGS